MGFTWDYTPYPDLQIFQACVSTLLQICQGKAANTPYLHSFLLEQLDSFLRF